MERGNNNMKSIAEIENTPISYDGVYYNTIMSVMDIDKMLVVRTLWGNAPTIRDFTLKLNECIRDYGQFSKPVDWANSVHAVKKSPYCDCTMGTVQTHDRLMRAYHKLGMNEVVKWVVSYSAWVKAEATETDIADHKEVSDIMGLDAAAAAKGYANHRESKLK